MGVLGVVGVLVCDFFPLDDMMAGVGAGDGDEAGEG